VHRVSPTRIISLSLWHRREPILPPKQMITCCQIPLGITIIQLV